ncbi:MAG: SHOCT domain-containing protein [Rhodospirillales bacterium]|nr:SHOCT domain-containing protein [Rhodospirillales bacterium]MBO6785912.1 SHOCT domain-containing protein [Rhodospirillales bacterium]
MRKILTGALAGLLAATISTAALAQYNQGGYYYGDHPMMWGGMFMGPVMMLLMVVFVVIAVIVIARIFGFGGHKAPSGTHDRALEILGERFAKGEIDKAEFEERKKALGG